MPTPEENIARLGSMDPDDPTAGARPIVGEDVPEDSAEPDVVPTVSEEAVRAATGEPAADPSQTDAAQTDAAQTDAPQVPGGQAEAPRETLERPLSDADAESIAARGTHDNANHPERASAYPSPAPAHAAPLGDKPVLVGVDGSADGLRAVAFGVRAARPNGLRLHLVHSVDDAVLAGAWGVVYDPTSLQQVGQDVVQQAVDHAKQLGMDESQIDAEVVLGNAAAVLSALSEDSSLVVIGRRAIGGLERMFVGSTSVSVAATAKCPVIVISAAANPDPTGQYGLVGVGVEFTRGSPKPLEFAFQEASRRGAQVLVRTVQSNVPAGMSGGYRLTDRANSEVTRAVEQQLDELVRPVAARYPDVGHRCEVSLGPPVEQLLAMSETVDLMVLGMRQPKVLGFSIGGVTRAVMAHAKSPLAVIR